MHAITISQILLNDSKFCISILFAQSQFLDFSSIPEKFTYNSVQFCSDQTRCVSHTISEMNLFHNRGLITTISRELKSDGMTSHKHRQSFISGRSIKLNT